MNRVKVASEILKIAKELVAMEFPTQDALDKYLKEHPGADRSLHRVVKSKPTANPSHVNRLMRLIEKTKQKSVSPRMDKDEQKMYRSDSGDYQTILEHLKNGQYAYAVNTYERMDTAARDELPASVVNFLYKHGRKY